MTNEHLRSVERPTSSYTILEHTFGEHPLNEKGFQYRCWVQCYPFPPDFTLFTAAPCRQLVAHVIQVGFRFSLFLSDRSSNYSQVDFPKIILRYNLQYNLFFAHFLSKEVENFAIRMAEAKLGGEKGKKILSYVAKRSRRAQEKVLGELLSSL